MPATIGDLTVYMSTYLAVSLKRIAYCHHASCLKVIPDYTFMNCKVLEDIDLPSGGLADIGRHAFQCCKLFKSIEMPPTTKKMVGKHFMVVTICKELFFWRAWKRLGIKVLPTVQSCDASTSLLKCEVSIGLCSFAFCKGLETVNMSDDAQSFPLEAFQSCYSIKNIEHVSWKLSLSHRLYSG